MSRSSWLFPTLQYRLPICPLFTTSEELSSSTLCLSLSVTFMLNVMTKSSGVTQTWISLWSPTSYLADLGDVPTT